MKKFQMLTALVLLLTCMALPAQDQNSAPKGNSWTKSLEDRSKRGTLHGALQKVRGDTGKWNDDPSLQHAPPIARKPAKLSLDDWADQLRESEEIKITGNDETWLLFKTRQLDDNDRVWIQRIERDGNQFTVVVQEAIWQGRYMKSFTYYNVYGVNLGKLSPGQYKVKWIVQPLEFRTFEGNGRPIDENRTENWPKDEQPADKKPAELSVEFVVREPSK